MKKARNRMSTASWRQVVNACVSDKDLERIFTRLIREASTGDVQAAALILQYSLGKPRVASIALPRTLDLGEMRTQGQCHAALVQIAKEQMHERLDGDQAALALSIVDRAMRLILSQGDSKKDDSRPVEVNVQSYSRPAIDVTEN